MQSLESKLLGVFWLAIIYGIVYTIYYRIKANKVLKKAADEYAATKQFRTPSKATTKNTTSSLGYQIEDWAYEQVGKELDLNNPDKGLWTKAFAQAGGDDKQTRVLYIKARVEKLIAVEQARLDNLRREQEDQNHIAEEVRVEQISILKKDGAEECEENTSRETAIRQASPLYKNIATVQNVRSNANGHEKKILWSILGVAFIVVAAGLMFKPSGKASDWDSDARAHYNLALSYQTGKGMPQDFKEAVRLYRLAAEQGHSSAQNNLAYMYENGEGTLQDYKEAAKWYTLSAEQGNSGGQTNLGFAYAEGKIVPKDLKAAFFWLEKGALAGEPMAQVSLGWAYMSDSLDLDPDYKLAMQWNLKASNQGAGEGSANIGLLYENGWGVPVSYFEAANWYKKAIEQGGESEQALFQLGGLYEKGLGVQKDLNEAGKLYRAVVEKFGKSKSADEAKNRLSFIQR